jgi:hypothetical protein
MAEIIGIIHVCHSYWPGEYEREGEARKALSLALHVLDTTDGSLLTLNIISSDQFIAEVGNYYFLPYQVAHQWYTGQK